MAPPCTPCCLARMPRPYSHTLGDWKLLPAPSHYIKTWAPLIFQVRISNAPPREAARLLFSRHLKPKPARMRPLKALVPRKSSTVRGFREAKDTFPYASCPQPLPQPSLYRLHRQKAEIGVRRSESKSSTPLMRRFAHASRMIPGRAQGTMSKSRSRALSPRQSPGQAPSIICLP